MSLLTSDAIIAKTMLENHAKTRDIQKATRDKVTGMRKMRISDINNLKGVSNLGGERLKSFPVAFAWVSDETETIYVWFSKALMNGLDFEFPVNKKLLCGWHMINNIAKMAKKTRKAGEDKNTCTNLINSMIFGDGAGKLMQKRELFRSLASCEDLKTEGLSEDGKNGAVKSFEEYFEKELMSCKEKWAGYLTNKLKHFDCVTTQRVESGHHAPKRSISALQSLDSSFEQICSYLLQFEGDCQDRRLDEELVTDARILADERPRGLVHSVSRMALFTIRAELLEEVTIGEAC
ncbi:hypothetical protein PHYBLDRAFT_64245 [Phycomyces blakesleeanus NRRL 1555(-)]|uniref:MULE transposase domain-containing protein n=1 Tax=Phycomyces blakesleeanus (strain ATCC 8743b / DSM 1359 / FGSC 10004 / NBRC 33097 / NRRL 1555) TaxID=763407 RepID=A0A167N8F1_PHYB8|nr:hypothetical protein PHYBLDRAFT_64245 [Phycomyces blakesleeanus NRRL 1555(-)]OAD75320.1 hypothetical protein PHYBLDRAFT_64245 [Phycomyces blakesleeanus NRRL 1555(-)]|eukprot:XP_018293360.1 hypothetical protein PHYBLDRAFT_64245 [Phycomyces blakesleeanus NRRL 1555(-)]